MEGVRLVRGVGMGVAVGGRGVRGKGIRMMRSMRRGGGGEERSKVGLWWMDIFARLNRVVECESPGGDCGRFEYLVLWVYWVSGVLYE